MPLRVQASYSPTLMKDPSCCNVFSKHRMLDSEIQKRVISCCAFFASKMFSWLVIKTGLALSGRCSAAVSSANASRAGSPAAAGGSATTGGGRGPQDRQGVLGSRAQHAHRRRLCGGPCQLPGGVQALWAASRPRRAGGVRQNLPGHCAGGASCHSKALSVALLWWPSGWKVTTAGRPQSSLVQG